uniref:N-acetyltransferase domain-containing protein n=1 Tax=Mycena chlorophos TaxID=658473 RepID=A0ABQ0MBL4_MYCCL|nr:predicted protein [Mycena chlorophos]
MSFFRPPFTESALETSRVKLVLFTEVHFDQFFEAKTKHPDLLQYFAIDLNRDAFKGLLAMGDKNPDDAAILFAVLDKTKGDAFAGIIGLLHASTSNLSIELGPVITFPEFQQTFVTSNAIGILLRYCLNLPKHGGLGFRRVQWTANQDNVASIRTAEKMGLKLEGILRWNMVLAPTKQGAEVSGERGSGQGRHTAMLATCWDDWENGGRELVDTIVERT